MSEGNGGGDKEDSTEREGVKNEASRDHLSVDLLQGA